MPKPVTVLYIYKQFVSKYIIKIKMSVQKNHFRLQNSQFCIKNVFPFSLVKILERVEIFLVDLALQLLWDTVRELVLFLYEFSSFCVFNSHCCNTWRKSNLKLTILQLLITWLSGQTDRLQWPQVFPPTVLQPSWCLLFLSTGPRAARGHLNQHQSTMTTTAFTSKYTRGRCCRGNDKATISKLW